MGQTIHTIAGNGDSGSSGDKGPATSAELKYPRGIAIDSVGNIYIADSTNYRIRKISGGIITTFAGTGSYGLKGDGGPATEAWLSEIHDVMVDKDDNVYVVDTFNHCIRKIDKNGVITRFAGVGFAYFSGDGGPAVEAEMDRPHAIAMDSKGNLYIADTYNHRIRKVNTNGIISTAVGNGSAGFSGDGGSALAAQLFYPYGIAIDSKDNIYIADTLNYRIRKVTTDGKISTIAGTGKDAFDGDGGPATAACLGKVRKLSVDAEGNLYFGL